jgi:hypothetical protein
MPGKFDRNTVAAPYGPKWSFSVSATANRFAAAATPLSHRRERKAHAGE